ncbi:Calmodulin [Mycoblastus sanguinarius]|nr:Calmodulin [Mycoblastus sanguinarius]
MNEIDMDHSGSISFDGRPPNPFALDSILSLVITKMSPLLKHTTEFATVMAQKLKSTDTEAELRAAFNVFDRDGNGTINKEELVQIMKSIGEGFTDEEIEEMMKEADKDGNGTIDYDEFVQLVK